MPVNSSISHPVTLIPQPTQTTCWAASTAMLIGSTVQNVINQTPKALVASDGGLKNYSDQDDWLSGTRDFAQAHRLQYGPPRTWTTEALHAQLSSGPIMIDMLWNAQNYISQAGSPGHMVLITGMSADNNGVTLTYNDPWPPNRGAVTTVNYATWLQQVPTRTYRTFWK
ncbi:MAG: papain-like cysteine protease family protein [Pseudomonadota bacterium]